MKSLAFCLQPPSFPCCRRKVVLSRTDCSGFCEHTKSRYDTKLSVSRPGGSPHRPSFRSFLSYFWTRKRSPSTFRNNQIFSGGTSDGGGGGRFGYVFDEHEPPRRDFGILLLLKSTLKMLQASRTLDGFYTFVVVYSLVSCPNRPQLGSCSADTNTKGDLVQPEKCQKYSAFISETTRPAVVLLSFLGAKQRQLKKYADFYFSKGYDVYIVFNNLPTAIFPAITQRQARKVLDILERIPDGQPVFVHAISIGTGIWGLVLEEFRKNNKRLEHLKGKISGVIYDSGPSNVSPSLMANGLYSACPKLSKEVWNIITSVTFLLTRAGAKFRVGELALQDHQVEQAPQLYLYSRDDHVINSLHESVQKFVEKNKQRGVEVYQQVWEKSLHATHLKVHPEEYMRSVEDFLNRCLQLRNSVNRCLTPRSVQAY
ncbi:uncharacterized protein Gasu_05040 [Galdieria sulphuraria]|uniref:Transmembrane protein 53 n=1 Tax=Galdieria sulphuraria TaxID=130081 RepID=M2Y8N2_GALSU|nr:uncharacterized protein Gasu_05040 [Galdieria sulphuraria]EME32418.1 hypothetical protein Gasu_05040 [Galdieria sulphuraria]|eukprot:XP_005708938.1 hypothetical protein Gasu_05040 [Galdieria sulphuraria]